MLFKVYNRYYSCSSDACFCKNLWYLLTLELCLFISFTVSWMSCGVMFISSIGMESLLGGGAKPGTGGRHCRFSSGGSMWSYRYNQRRELGLQSLQPVGYYITNIKKFIFLIIEDFNHWFEPFYIGAYPIDSPHYIYYYWT